MPRSPITTEPEADRAVLVAVERQGKPLDQDLQELQELVRTAGGKTMATVIQRRQSPDPATYMGKGKVEEVKEYATEIFKEATHLADLVARLRDLGQVVEQPG